MVTERTDETQLLLARVNALLVGLRRALGWRHDDEARWASWGITAPEAQALRVKLRAIADVLHVERATARGRLHGGTRRFATLQAQRAWVTERARRSARSGDRHAPLARRAQQRHLRAKKLTACTRRSRATLASADVSRKQSKRSTMRGAERPAATAISASSCSGNAPATHAAHRSGSSRTSGFSSRCTMTSAR